MQNIVIAGRVVKEDAKSTTEGASATFSLGVPSRARNKDGQYENTTVFYDVYVGGKLAEFSLKHATKGKALLVAGTLGASVYNAKDGTARLSLKVFASTITFAPDSKEAAKAKEEEIPF